MHALLAQDIMPLGTFKATATAVLRDLNLRSQPLVLTQNGRPAAVLLSPHGVRRAHGKSAFSRSCRGRCR